MPAIKLTVRVRQKLNGVMRETDVRNLAEHLASLVTGEHHVSHMDVTVEVTNTTVDML